MNVKIKYVLAVFLVCAAFLSFLYHTNKNRFVTEDLLAPVIINIEANKSYIHNYSIAAEPDSRIFNLAPTCGGGGMKEYLTRLFIRKFMTSLFRDFF
jgi:hypothetical protein